MTGMAHIPDLQQTRHIGTAALSGPITAGWSVKITSSGLISRLAAMYRPIVSDLPKMRVFEFQITTAQCMHSHVEYVFKISADSVSRYESGN